jgi:ubiquinone/menaquinone biosynthesis C-methylase UbiE
LARQGYEVTLTDISQGMLDVAREKLLASGLLGQVAILQQDIRDMADLDDEAFDLVLAEGDPLSYCQDPMAAVRELARLARVGAHVIASVDSRIACLYYLNQLDFEAAARLLRSGQLAWRGETDEFSFPIHAFTVAELTGLFEAHGLRVVRVLGKPVFFRRLSADTQAQILADDKLTQRMVELECRYADDPAWAGSGGHIEVTGIRIW